MNDIVASKPRGARRRWLAGVALAAVFVAGGLAGTTLSAAAQGLGDMGMGDHMAMMSGHGGMHGQAMMQHVETVLDHIGATPDQKSRIEAIVHTGLKPMMDAHHGMGDIHTRLIAILTAPTIDRAALEQLRAAELAKFDVASRAMTRTLADAAEVLTPEQRAKLGEMIKAHHHDG